MYRLIKNIGRYFLQLTLTFSPSFLAIHHVLYRTNPDFSYNNSIAFVLAFIATIRLYTSVKNENHRLIGAYAIYGILAFVVGSILAESFEVKTLIIFSILYICAVVSLNINSILNQTANAISSTYNWVKNAKAKALYS